MTTETRDDDTGLPIAALLDLMLLAGRLKNLPRTGWLLAGIKECESIAEHGFRVVLLALVLADLMEGVDREKLLRIAIVHDLPESVITDLPRESVLVLGRETKQRAEQEAWASLLPASGQLDEWRALWQEYKAGRTLEARLTRAADRLEMLLQAYEYQQVGYRNLDGFWGGEDLDDADLRPVQALLTELARRRDQLSGRQAPGDQASGAIRTTNDSGGGGAP